MVIRCVLTELLSQMHVDWSTSTNVDKLGLNPSDGTLQGSTQTSSLSLSSAQLAKLKTAGGANPSHIFTCKIKAGKKNTEFSATQTVDILAPGKHSLKSAYVMNLTVESKFLILPCVGSMEFPIH